MNSKEEFYELKGDSIYVTDERKFWCEYEEFLDDFDYDEGNSIKLFSTVLKTFTIKPDRWIKLAQKVKHRELDQDPVDYLVTALYEVDLEDFCGDEWIETVEVKGERELMEALLDENVDSENAIEKFNQDNRHIEAWFPDPSKSAHIKVEFPVDA